MVKILRHLKLYRLLAAAFMLMSFFAQSAPKQEVLEKEVTISLKEVTLKQALQEIELAAKVKFVYSRSYLDLDEKVSIEATGKRLGQLLDELLTPREIRFSVHESNQFVVLTQAKLRGALPEEQITNEAIPSPIHLAGRVLDAGGLPMAGVNVVEKGTTNGTSTDANGAFSMEASENATLIFSFIGYKSVEVPVMGRTVIDISMEEDKSVLDAVLVNAGYWKVSEREQTGSISRITAEDIQKQPVGNPLAALIGRMPGVNIQQSSGLPGGQFSLQIRGRNSLRTEGNYPLYIVDGVPFPSVPQSSSSSVLGSPSPLNSMNPADIESIEILKDADATAIYGTRGANGVVLITTRKGGPGKTKLDLNFYTGIGKVSKFMDLLNTEQYLMMRHEAHKNDEEEIQSYEYDLLEWDTTRYTDWQKVLIGGTSKITNAQFSLSGGSGGTTFQFGSGYYEEGTVLPGNFRDQKVNTHFNLSHRSNDGKFNLSLQTNYVFDRNTLPFSDPTSLALNLPPNAPPLYNDDGTFNWANGTWTLNVHPLAFTLLDYSIQSTNLISNVLMRYEIAPNLFIKTSFGYNNLTSREVTLSPIGANDPALNITTANNTTTNGSINTWIVEPQLEYNLKIGQGFLTSLIGSTFQETVRDGLTLRGDGFTNNSFLENLRAAPRVSIREANNTQYRYTAVFARVNYNFGGRYLLNLTGRRDGSSRFGPGNRFANFGAVGAAWVFSKESFFSAVPVVSFGKLRASYGITGNDQIPDYGYLESYSASQFPYQGRSGLIPTRLANPNYGWETSQKAEVALEIGMLKDRIFFTTAAYRNRSSNQLVGYSLPRITGFSSIQYNLPATVQNTGIELSLRTENIVKRDFSWSTTFNLTVPKNKLVAYPGISNSPDNSRWEVGKSLNMGKTFHLEGVDPATGLYAYQDLDQNGSGTDYPLDLQATKFLGQKLYGGLGNNIRYKNLSIDFLFQFVNQTTKNELTVFSTFYNPGSMSNQPVHVLSRWQKPGDITSVQKFTNTYDGYNAFVSASSGDNGISDASFVRLKNVSISYNLPVRIMKSKRIQSARVYLQGQNLLTFSDYIGLDPETGVISSLPPLRYITAGLQVSL